MTSATAAVAPVAAQPLPQTSRAFEVAFAPARPRVGHMRRITRAYLGLWDVASPVAEDVVLAVSELVTNAVEHGWGDVALRVQHTDETLRVTVTDGSPAPANLRSADDDDDSGRGLLLVAVLAHKWGIGDNGRTTWCEFRAPASRP
ncbi:ATP-binding protein [Streptomyces sp. ODS28]|uniref:ATP-binding protein n=1 Tax=Streptomyces sp. ODS28 TaxID=3136688 RepID=UPI0031E72346